MKYLWVFLFVTIEILKFLLVAAATKHVGHVLPFVFHPASIKTVENSNNIQGFFPPCCAASGYTEFFLLSFFLLLFSDEGICLFVNKEFSVCLGANGAGGSLLGSNRSS